MKSYGIKLLAAALAFLITVGVLPIRVMAAGIEAVSDGDETDSESQQSGRPGGCPVCRVWAICSTG